jgi:hypothetical protein
MVFLFESLDGYFVFVVELGRIGDSGEEFTDVIDLLLIDCLRMLVFIYDYCALIF